MADDTATAIPTGPSSRVITVVLAVGFFVPVLLYLRRVLEDHHGLPVSAELFVGGGLALVLVVLFNFQVQQEAKAGKRD
jgi:hypothetical protein